MAPVGRAGSMTAVPGGPQIHRCDSAPKPATTATTTAAINSFTAAARAERLGLQRPWLASLWSVLPVTGGWLPPGP